MSLFGEALQIHELALFSPPRDGEVKHDLPNSEAEESRDDQLWDGVLLEAVTGREAWSWRSININMQLYDIRRAGDAVA